MTSFPSGDDALAIVIAKAETKTESEYLTEVYEAMKLLNDNSKKRKREQKTLTEKHRRNVSLGLKRAYEEGRMTTSSSSWFTKGHTPWNKGLKAWNHGMKWPPEVKEKISKGMIQ